MPVDLHRLTKGWLELESDPGLFTLLLEDFGVKGIQVEEIYDLQKLIDGPVYGFIFLFKWIEERRSRRKIVVTEECFVENEETVNSIFFAQQVVPNSCATHALLSVLLNCPRLHLGPTLTRLKDYTKNMSPENKGYAIGNTPELARAHNSHAKPQPFSVNEKSHNVSTGRTKEAFHFVSYVPIKGRLFELDGLKPSPIDHGPWGEGEDWTETFRRVITERLGIATSGEPYHDVRFNLMAVVPDKRIACEQKLRTLKTNRQTVLEALQQLVKLTNPELTSADRAECIAVVDTAKTTKRPGDAISTPTTSSVLKISPDKRTEEPLTAHSNSPLKPLSIDTTASSDLMKPLSIQTKFHASPTPSASSSTDTSSETGSAFNSPVRPLPAHFSASPNSKTSTASKSSDASIFEDVKEIKKFMVIRVTSASSSRDAPMAEAPKESADMPEEGKSEPETTKNGCDNLKRQLSSDSLFSGEVVAAKRPSIEDSDSNTSGGQEVSRITTSKIMETSSSCQETTASNVSKKGQKQLPLVEPHKFAPKDLLALLKTVENEISICENNLRDEVDKRRKYKIDDSRRTHNYDQFVCTFLSMLAEQGHLTDLVEQQLMVRKRQGIQVGRLHRTTKKPEQRKKVQSKRRK